MFVHKVDEELYLKLVELQDAEALYQLTNQSRDYLREWLPWLDSIRRVEDTTQFIQESLKGYAEHKLLNTVIMYKNQMVGMAGFNEFEWSNRVAYIGYWLAEEFQGQGIMTRVASSLTDYAIHTLHFNRIDIRAAVENRKSRAIPERLGYKEEGRIREAEWLYDHYVDHIVYGMLAKDWK